MLKSYIIRDSETIQRLTNDSRFCVIISIDESKRTAKISNKDFTKFEAVDYNAICHLDNNF